MEETELDFAALLEQNDPKKDLEEFSTYDASYITEKINSTTDGSKRKWVRKASFLQLGYVLDLYKTTYSNSLEENQKKEIDTFIEFTFSDSFKNQDMTQKSDIERALHVLEVLGVDMSKARQKLAEWPA